MTTAFLLGIAASCLFPPWVLGEAQASTYEYQVKAVYLYNFTRYLQWPEGKAPEAFEIAVLGESDILAPLREISTKRTVGSIPLVLRRCQDLGQIGHPRILFIAKSASRWLPQVLEKTRGTETLTVGEEEGGAASGVAVNFILRDGAVKFEINERTLKEAHIQPGSQLLKLAIRVNDEKRGGRP